MAEHIAREPEHIAREPEHIAREPEHIAREPEQIAREQLIPAPPDAVWEVLTGDGWLAERVALELVPGGEARFDDRTGWVEEALAGRRLVFWWASEGEPASRVELTLEPAGEASTRLRVIEARPLEALDIVGLSAPGSQADRGPMLLAA